MEYVTPIKLKKGIEMNSGRFQQTKIENEIFTKKGIKIGLQQGAVLTSSLFSIYIYDICNNQDNRMRINLFIDNSTICYLIKDT